MTAPSRVDTALSEQLQRCRELLEAGELRKSVELQLALPAAEMTAAQQLDLATLQCRAAFRAGEHADAVEAAARVLALSEADTEAGLAARFDALAVQAVSAGELASFELSLEGLPEMMTLANRRRDGLHWVRARGTAASVLSLLGDPWAARRVLVHLRDNLAGAAGDRRFEPTVHNNLASVELLVARMARDAGDAEALQAALERAKDAVDRATQVALDSGQARLEALAAVHRVELQVLGGSEDPGTRRALDDFIDSIAASGQNSHLRQFLLLRAEARLAAGEPRAAVPDLERVQTLAHEGTELSTRVRARQLLARALRETGDWQGALTQASEGERLARTLGWRIACVNSTHARIRLELEHLFLARPFAA